MECTVSDTYRTPESNVSEENHAMLQTSLNQKLPAMDNSQPQRAPSKMIDGQSTFGSKGVTLAVYATMPTFSPFRSAREDQQPQEESHSILTSVDTDTTKAVLQSLRKTDRVCIKDDFQASRPTTLCKNSSLQPPPYFDETKTEPDSLTYQWPENKSTLHMFEQPTPNFLQDENESVGCSNATEFGNTTDCQTAEDFHSSMLDSDDEISEYILDGKTQQSPESRKSEDSAGWEGSEYNLDGQAQQSPECRTSEHFDSWEAKMERKTKFEANPIISRLLSITSATPKFKLTVSIRTIAVGLVVCTGVACLTISLVSLVQGFQHGQRNNPSNEEEKFQIPVLQSVKRLVRNTGNEDLWVRFKYNEYKVITDTLKWLQAKSRCAASNASLVYIMDAEENTKVVNIIAKRISSFHTALKRFEETGWFWVERKLVDILQSVKYTNWYVDYDASGQPYTATAYIDTKDGKWRADWENEARPSICKRPTKDAEEKFWPADEPTTTPGATSKPLITTLPSCPCENGGKCVEELKLRFCQCPVGFEGQLCEKQAFATTQTAMRKLVDTRRPEGPTSVPVKIPKTNTMSKELGVVFIVCISLITISILCMIILLIKWKMAIHKSKKQATKKVFPPSISDNSMDTMSKIYIGCDDDGYETIDDSHIGAEHSRTDADGDIDLGHSDTEADGQTDGEEAVVLISPHELQDMYITQPCIFTYGRSGLVPSGQ